MCAHTNSQKQFLSVTKQTGSIKMDNPTNLNRQVDGGGEHFKGSHHVHSLSSKAEQKKGYFLTVPAWYFSWVSVSLLIPDQEGEVQQRVAEGGDIHLCLLKLSHDGCICLSLSAGYLDAVTARKISDGELLRPFASPPSPSNQ